MELDILLFVVFMIIMPIIVIIITLIKSRLKGQNEVQEETIENHKEMPTTPYFENDNKKDNNKRNTISGIVFIILGVIMILHSAGRNGSSAMFGGDFYTEVHEQVSLAVSNLHSIAIILKDGFGFLFIGLGIDRLTKK